MVPEVRRGTPLTGVVVRDGDRGVILVPGDAAEEFQVHIVAHELWHLMSGHFCTQQALKGYGKTARSRFREACCERFARKVGMEVERQRSASGAPIPPAARGLAEASASAAGSSRDYVTDGRTMGFGCGVAWGRGGPVRPGNVAGASHSTVARGRNRLVCTVPGPDLPPSSDFLNDYRGDARIVVYELVFAAWLGLPSGALGTFVFRFHRGLTRWCVFAGCVAGMGWAIWKVTGVAVRFVTGDVIENRQYALARRADDECHCTPAPDSTDTSAA